MDSIHYDESFPTPRSISRGDQVTFHYETTTLDGGVLESSGGRAPLTVTLGDTAVVAGVQRALEGRAEGDSFSVRLAPDEAFGHRRPDWLVSIPLGNLPDGVSAGDQVSVHCESDTFPAWVQKLSEKHAILDANHPLAGETTLVKIDIVSVTSP